MSQLHISVLMGHQKSIPNNMQVHVFTHSDSKVYHQTTSFWYCDISLIIMCYFECSFPPYQNTWDHSLQIGDMRSSWIDWTIFKYRTVFGAMFSLQCNVRSSVSHSWSDLCQDDMLAPPYAVLFPIQTYSPQIELYLYAAFICIKIRLPQDIGG